MKFELIICDLQHGREFNARTETHDIGNVTTGKEALAYGRRVVDLWNNTATKHELQRKVKAARIIGAGESMRNVPLIDLRHLSLFPKPQALQ